jgi:transcriptional regulator with XRE-family HTH domain
MPATPTVALREDKIKELLAARKLSRLELAQLAGYSVNLLDKTLAGYQPSRMFAWHLAQALGVPTEDITADGTPIPEPAVNPRRLARMRVPALSP